ncbi:MAG TPA: FAD-dependent oxidoreductase [Solirubrobacteraceae bacterium]|jgi:NADPH-dependent 2,4-dienoyl-CoA reductase/sulfur reductase-like enzyme
MSERYEWLIIGGGPAGIAAARGYRDAGGGGSVAIITDEHRMPYRRPPLTKELLRGEIGEDELPIESEDWLREERISLISGRAVSLDADRREVMMSGGRGLEYGDALLATGAEPMRMPVPGADHPGVRVIRTLDHVRELIARLGDGDPVVVIGSGFIGCEIAASLRQRGHPVTLISDESEPNAARLGEAAARRIRGWLEAEGVDLRLGAAVESIAPGFIVTGGDAKVRAPVLVMAGGVAPRAELAASAGLELESGAVPVDAHQRTARPGLYAAGDVAFAENATAGRHLRVEHWGDALGQGEVAGRNAAGADAVWDAVPGFWSTIGEHVLKYAAWGDGFNASRFEDHGDGAFTVWYGREGTIVGVLTHERDEDYESGSELIGKGAPWR